MTFVYLIGGLLLVALITFVAFIIEAKVKKKTFQIGKGDDFVRITPNFGYQLGNKRWSRVNGTQPPYRPVAWGLAPGVIADEGTELYDRRMEYVAGPEAYRKKRNL